MALNQRFLFVGINAETNLRSLLAVLDLATQDRVVLELRAAVLKYFPHTNAAPAPAAGGADNTASLSEPPKVRRLIFLD